MSAPLAILDWGIGGVGVLTQLRRRSPDLPFIYLSDAGYPPYGLLPKSTLKRRVRMLIAALVGWGARSVVVACNAASTVSDELALENEIPVWSVISSALRLVPGDLCGTLGIIGGQRTIRSGVYRRGLSAPGRKVVQRIAQPLSAHIEAGRAHGAECGAELDRILTPLRRTQALLLACTHYPAIRPLIQRRLPNTELLDPAAALAEDVLGRLAPDGELGFSQRVLTTGDPHATRRAALRAWDFDLGEVEHCSLAAGRGD